MADQAHLLGEETAAALALLEEVALLAAAGASQETLCLQLAEFAARAFSLDHAPVAEVDKTTGDHTVLAAYPDLFAPGCAGVETPEGLRDLAKGHISLLLCSGPAPAGDDGFSIRPRPKPTVTVGVLLDPGEPTSLVLYGTRRHAFSADELQQISGMAQAARRVLSLWAETFATVGEEPGPDPKTLNGLTASESWAEQAHTLVTLTSLYRAVAHDVNNALAAIVGQGQVLLEELSRAQASAQGALAADWLGEQRGRVRVVLDRALNLMTVVRALHEYVAARPLTPRERADLAELAREVARVTSCVWQTEARARGLAIDLQCETDGPVPVLVVPEQLKKAIVHVVFNAIQAVENTGGRIVVRVRGEERGLGPQAVCEVEDDGEGMSDDVLRRARKPFFTSRPERCQGLGLTLADGILRQHGGSLELTSQPGQGTCVRMFLPLAEEAEA
ncbi:MAG: HAMP domain-containing histidine kinase [Armatimonadetes bacterium]|nr:HAMP domain-containing histidine kinase [Armatimonadota bacterium]